MMVLNMYQELPSLIIRPLPFDSKYYGMWYFDGQFFYLKKRRPLQQYIYNRERILGAIEFK